MTPFRLMLNSKRTTHRLLKRLEIHPVLGNQLDIMFSLCLLGDPNS